MAGAAGVKRRMVGISGFYWLEIQLTGKEHGDVWAEGEKVEEDVIFGHGGCVMGTPDGCVVAGRQLDPIADKEGDLMILGG